MITFHIVQHINGLDPHALQSALNVFSLTELDRHELKRNHLEDFENKIMEDLPKYYNLDLSTCVASLLKLGFVPR